MLHEFKTHWQQPPPASFRPRLLGYASVWQAFRTAAGHSHLSLQVADEPGLRSVLSNAVADITARQLYQQLGVQRPAG